MTKEERNTIRIINEVLWNEVRVLEELAKGSVESEKEAYLNASQYIQSDIIEIMKRIING